MENILALYCGKCGTRKNQIPEMFGAFVRIYCHMCREKTLHASNTVEKLIQFHRRSGGKKTRCAYITA